MSNRELGTKVAAILASFREFLGVSRARCYVMDSSGDFRLGGSYGFIARFGPDDVLGQNHALIEWVQRHRKPTYANSLEEAGPLAPVMEREQYARALSAPVYLGSRLVAILELQDKLGGVAFGPEDLRRAERVVVQLGPVLKEHDSTAVAAPEPIAPEDTAALFVAPLPVSTTDFPPPPPLFHSSETATDGKPASPLLSVTPSDLEARPEPNRRELLLFKGFCNVLILNPDVEAVVFSLWGRERGELFIGSRHPFADSARQALLRNLEAALSAAARFAMPREKRFQSEFPLGRVPGEIQEFAGIQTSLLSSDRSLLLCTILFAQPPSAGSEEALKETHRLIRSAVLQIRSAERYRASYRSLVKSLLEPGQKSYPQLKAHSLAVAALSRRFACALRLSEETVEQLTVAGLLHDVGLREIALPYERLAGRRPLDLQELALVREHCAVGATFLERIEFPYPVAPLVRHHHERFDGSGYPDRLSGETIPLGARLIGIVEAYDAMTAPHSYRSPISSQGALDIILGKGGTQFDPQLARRFCELIRSSAPGPEAAKTFPEFGP